MDSQNEVENSSSKTTKKGKRLCGQQTFVSSFDLNRGITIPIDHQTHHFPPNAILGEAILQDPNGSLQHGQNNHVGLTLPCGPYTPRQSNCPFSPKDTFPKTNVFEDILVVVHREYCLWNCAKIFEPPPER